MSTLEQFYGGGVVRTDIDCTECRGLFVAKVNLDWNGNHEIVCPHCGHTHYRLVEGGRVTDTRWHSGHVTHEVPTTRQWASVNQGIKTTAAHNFIRERWLGGR